MRSVPILAHPQEYRFAPLILSAISRPRAAPGRSSLQPRPERPLAALSTPAPAEIGPHNGSPPASPESLNCVKIGNFPPGTRIPAVYPAPPGAKVHSDAPELPPTRPGP